MSPTDLRIVLGGMQICVNNVTSDFRPTNDIGEGYYWGYDPFELDSKPDEIHAWVMYRNHLIDYTAQFFEMNFNVARPHLNEKMYTWNRKPFPKVLFCRNVTPNKLYREYGIRYKADDTMTLEAFKQREEE